MTIRRLTGSITAITLLAAACGGGGDAGSDTGGATPPAATPPAAVADAGTITGTIAFTGEAPAMSAVDMSGEPDCAATYSSPPMEQTVVAGNGTLANVFVYIKEGLSGAAPAAGGPASVNQEGCRYHPHVLGVQVGQEIAFQNSDGLLHNIKADPTNNRPFNISQPNNMTSTRSFAASEVMVPVVCDVHGWMNMYIGVLDHPYFAVSNNGGSFSIGNVPPGTYTVEAWHERYGTQTMQVTVDPNGTATADFAYSASMAANAVVPLGTPIDPHDHGTRATDR